MKSQGQLTMSDRIVIEAKLSNKESFRQIAQELGRHPTTIATEVRQNRMMIIGRYPYGNDCRLATKCMVHYLCGNGGCHFRCVSCHSQNCRDLCDKYVSNRCRRLDTPPYVCNACTSRSTCTKEMYLYIAKHADETVTRRRSESRQGIRIGEEEKESLNTLLSRLVNKGQPLAHIYAEHEAEIPVCLRSLYNYIDSGELAVRNIDLRRKTTYRPRKTSRPKDQKNAKILNQKFRLGRNYDDFLLYMKDKSEHIVTEMDTVLGKRGKGKRLLTMIFRKNSVMLLFLLPDGTTDSVRRVFDFLEVSLGYEVFVRLFPIILTDNGSEFKGVTALEQSNPFTKRTSIFYCDPMASWQKPHIEKNHEFIRYVIPKGKSMSPYTQDDMTLLANHINSVRRPGLGNKTPYELAEDDVDMQLLMELLKMYPIPADEVHLKPDLLKK